MTDSLFSDLRVVDCASWIAGPCAATMMSDFGADVIKVEPPGIGDPWRTRGPIPGRSVDYYWQLTARNKRSLALDLKHPDGVAALHKLAASADVFVTNFPLPVRDRLQLSAAHLTSLNPKLIYASFTAYGEQGDEAAKTGFDSTAYWARTGLMDQVRASRSTAPARSMPGMGDHPSGTGLYAAIVTALYQREKTGKGAVVTSSLLQNGLWANACAVQTRLFGEDVGHRPLREEAPNALANHYQTRDGRWFIMALFNEQRQLGRFLTAIGRPELAGDARFGTATARQENANALTRILDEVFATRDLAEWRATLDEVGVTFGIVGTVDEVSTDAQMQACGALVPFAEGGGLTVSTPFQVEGAEKIPPRRAPAGVGQDTDDVLRHIGYTDEEIARLRGNGAVA